MPTFMNRTDEELMVEYQDGSSDAFDELYRRHSAKIYGFLRKRLGSSQLVDDVFQATFLKLHRSRSRYDASFPFMPWLFTVCRNVMLDTLKGQARVLEVSDEAVLARAVVESPQPVTAMPNLANLPGAQRKALELRYGQELSFGEIAKRLETSPGNVRQLVSRAVRKLRKSK